MKLLEVYREYMKLWDQHEDPVHVVGMGDRGVHMASANATEFVKWIENEGGAITGYHLEGGLLWLYGKLEDVQLYTLLYNNEIDIDLSSLRNMEV